MTLSGPSILTFSPPGPVAAGFIRARDAFNAIMGPMGSGKTSSCVMRANARCVEVPPSRITGERMYKLGVVRNTLTDLKRTTMKSIENWFGGAGQWGGGGASSEPPFFKIGFKNPDGTVSRMWFEFVGLDVHSVEQLAKGWEITDYWMNEADLMPRDVKDMLDGRIGRYPGRIHCDLPFYGGFADYNAPDTENWLYRVMEEERPASHVLFRQPGGRDAGAENVQNLPEGYYARMAEGKEDWWIRRNLDNLYGFSRDGEPVYPEYRDDFHCADGVDPVRGIVIRADFDQGLHPACVLRQTMPNGQTRILDEIYADDGASGLCRQLRALIGSARYAGHRIIGGMADPAAAARDATDAESWVDAVNRLMGWTGSERVRLAPTNEEDRRLGAVRLRLKTNVMDGRPGLLISSRCRALRKGFNSHYRYKQVGKMGMRSDKPEKIFPYADVHDALQYGALDDGGYEEVIGREKRRGGPFVAGKSFRAKDGVRLWT